MPVKRRFQVLTFMLIAVLFYGMTKYASHSETTPAVSLPDVSFYDKLGRPVTLDHFKGKVVLVNLWANWCAPCVAELPALANLQKKLSGEPFAIVAISTERSSVQEIRHFLDTRGAGNLEVYIDRDRQVPLRWKYKGLPTSFLLDRNGAVIKQYDGAYAWDTDPVLREVMGTIDSSS